MYVPKKMVQNEFKELVCPCPRDLYERIGARIPNSTGSSDGIEIPTDVVSFDNNKMSNLARMSNEDYSRYAEEMRKAAEKPIESPSNQVEDENV